MCWLAYSEDRLYYPEAILYLQIPSLLTTFGTIGIQTHELSHTAGNAYHSAIPPKYNTSTSTLYFAERIDVYEQHENHL